MRTIIFRILAGLIAIGFVWVFVSADNNGKSAREMFGMAALTIVFAGFAVFGPHPAESFLATVFGFGTESDSKPPPNRRSTTG
jgi:hypothetical protein